MTEKRLPKLTTTSFALLGLLQRQPWSAYELTRFMRNSILRAVWPRAESHLYSEPKLLEKRGYASSHREQNGGRKRTVYSITAAGEKALADWLQQERGSEFHFEYELLVRLAFAENQNLDQVRKYLEQVKREALQDCQEAILAVDAILAEPEQLRQMPASPYSGALVKLVAEQLFSRLSWADKTLAQLADYEGSEQLSSEMSVGIYEQARARLQELLDCYK